MVQDSDRLTDCQRRDGTCCSELCAGLMPHLLHTLRSLLLLASLFAAMSSWLKGLALGAVGQAKDAARERLQAGRGGGDGGGGTCSTELVFDFSNTHERITAMGGSMAYYQNWVTNHPNKEKIYAALFGQLRPALLRFRNTFAMNGRGAPVTDDMRADAELYAAATRVLGYAPPVLLTSWSPPAEFKQSGKTLGGCDGTAIKAGRRGFVYQELAEWWVESIKAYRALGVAPRYVCKSTSCTGCALAFAASRRCHVGHASVAALTSDFPVLVSILVLISRSFAE